MSLKSWLLVGGLLACGTATAQDWVGWPPKSTTASTARQADPGDVRLRLQPGANGVEVWADNALSGPMEVRVEAASGARIAGLPVTRILRTRGSERIAMLPRGTTAKLRLVAVPGAPGAQEDGFDYAYPLLRHEIRVGQLPQGRFSHRDAENAFAVDFEAPLGTSVIAARSGIVMQARDSAADDGRGTLAEANLVRILHDDGSMAVYAHLLRGSLQVSAGQPVQAGEVIAHSGNSGFSSGPHLHFVVQVNRGMRLEAVPFVMHAPQGRLQFPRQSDAPAPL